MNITWLRLLGFIVFSFAHVRCNHDYGDTCVLNKGCCLVHSKLVVMCNLHMYDLNANMLGGILPKLQLVDVCSFVRHHWFPLG